MKDASSTDVVCHRGQALTSFWQCGDLYAHDPRTLEPLGTAAWAAGFPSPTGISAHPKLDERTGELLVFGYGKEAPFLHLGLVGADGDLVRTWAVELPGPRLPHDLAFTEHYAIVNDLPLYWDPELLAQGIHLPRFFPDQPSRFGLIRRDGAGPVRWFDADPTYVLHWINAYEDGDEVVLDGYFQHDPSPAKRDDASPHLHSVYRHLDLEQLQARPHRWRFDLRTGQTREEPLSDRIMEFGMVSGQVAGRPHRYCYAMTGAPGWFLFDGLVRHDLGTGREDRYAFGDGVYGSETPFAPRAGATAEDDGYLVTFTTDVPNDRSECLVFDATDVAGGPIARVRLPERISSGTHSCWVPASQLPD
jgi:carotenoid cleavage dioxygenase